MRKGYSHIDCINYGHVPNRALGFGRKCLRCKKDLPIVMSMGLEAMKAYNKAWEDYFKSQGFTQKEIDKYNAKERDDLRVDEKGVEKYRKIQQKEIEDFVKAIRKILGG